MRLRGLTTTITPVEPFLVCKRFGVFFKEKKIGTSNVFSVSPSPLEVVGKKKRKGGKRKVSEYDE